MKIKMSLMLATIFLCLLAMSGLAVAKDLILVTGHDVLHVVDGDTDELIKEIPVEGFLREAIVGNDKKYVYTTNGRHTLHTVDLEQGKVVRSMQFDKDGWERHIYGFKIDSQGKTGYFHFMPRKLENGQAHVASAVIAQADLKTGKILRSVEIPYGVMKITLNEESGKIHALGQDVYTIDISGKGMTLADTYPLFDKGYNILPAWDTQYENGGVLLQNYYTATAMGLLMIDVKTGKITEMELPEEALVFSYGYVFNSDKSKAYGSMDEVSVIDMKTGALLGYEVIQSGTKFCVNISSDDTKVYVGGAGAFLEVYDAETLKLVKKIKLSTDAWDVRRMTL